MTKGPLGCDAVVEPRHGLAGCCRWRRLEEDLVADVGGRSARMINLAEKACRELHASGSEAALLLIFQECAFEIAVRCRHFVSQHIRILDRHRGALREILQHRMGSIAQQRYATLA